LDLYYGQSAGFDINMIAAYCQQRLSAPFTVEGSCNRVVFETWVETCLIPTLEPGQVLILDNATFHHGGRIAQLIQAAGCSMLVFACLFARLEPN
jgi:transposase